MVDTGMPYPYAELYGGAHPSANAGVGSCTPIIRGVAISAWKPNDRAHRCGICVKKFGFLRRRHHCRACGDVCCRRCLGFFLVDVPLAGVDISYACINCLRQHNAKQPTLGDDLANLAQTFDNQYETRIVKTTRVHTTGASTGSPPPVSPSFLHAPPSHAAAAGSASALTPCSSPHETEHKVIISQYHHHKLHSVCSLVSDYLECKGTAIVLMEDAHVWVLAHRGLRSSAMQSPNFLSLCGHAMRSKDVFTASRDRQKVPHSNTNHDVFRFFGAAPIFHKHKQFTPIGCIVALDTKLRDESSCKRVKKTLENLARLVMNVLDEEQNVLRVYASGDFKLFASSNNALDDRATMSSSATSTPTNLLASSASSVPPRHRFGVDSPLTSPNNAATSTSHHCVDAHRLRSRSFVIGEDAGFFARYAAESHEELHSMPRQHSRRHKAFSNPEPKTLLRAPPPPPPPPRATHDTHGHAAPYPSSAA